MPAEPIADLLRAAARRIARLDAEVLLAHALGVERLALLRDANNSADAPQFATMVARREAGEPVAYITGQREFWSLPLRVTPDVLIPRPDSETLIAEALAECAGNPPRRILDLGTGSGALLLAALSEWPDAEGLGVDQSAAALTVAEQNAKALGLPATFRQGDWAAGLTGKFDLILCNPPYIAAKTVLMADVADHEPHSALFAGQDGLDDYRRILPQIPPLLAAGGVAIFEFGENQQQALPILAQKSGLDCRIAHDLEGRPRAAVLRMPKALGNGPATV